MGEEAGVAAERGIEPKGRNARLPRGSPTLMQMEGSCEAAARQAAQTWRKAASALGERYEQISCARHAAQHSTG